MRKPLLEKGVDNLTDWEKLQVVHLTNLATVFTASYRGAKAEWGRMGGILRAQARTLELKESRFLEKALNAPGFGGDLTRIAKETLEAAGDPLKQLQLLRKRSGGTWFDVFQAVYYGNLLSGIKTHERNIIGNSFNVLANTLTPIGAAPADIIRAMTTGKPRTVYVREMSHAAVGAFLGVNIGMKNAAFTFRQGFRPSSVRAAEEGRFDTPRSELPGGLLNPWNIPGRALEAADEFFRAIAWHQELYAGLYAQVRGEGVTGHTRVIDRMAEVLAATDPTTRDAKTYQTLASAADTFAARAVFQEEPGAITNWLLEAKAPGKPLALRAAALFIAPFVKTPMAILRQGAEWSPAGFAMHGTPTGAALQDVVSKALGRTGVAQPDARAGSQALGRAALGTLMLAPIAWLAATGRLTGAPPDDEGEREEFYARGTLGNAVKVGDYWVRYVLFQPFSVPMAAIANAWEKWQDSQQDDAAAEEALLTAIMGAGASLLDQSFLSGLGTFIDAVNEPQRYAGRWLSLFAQGFVPLSGLARNVTQAADPVYRKPVGVKESVQSIIPGASDSLAPIRGRFGGQAQRVGPWWQRGFLVPEVSKEASDALTKELAAVGYRPRKPQPDIIVDGVTVTLTREQEDIFAAALGQERKLALERAIRHERYVGQPNEVKVARIEDASTTAALDVRARARRAILRKEVFAFDRLVSRDVQVALQRDRAAVLGQAGEARDAAVVGR